jgi:hypothetical protein
MSESAEAVFRDANALLNAMRAGWGPYTHIQPCGPGNFQVQTRWRNRRTGEDRDSMPQPKPTAMERLQALFANPPPGARILDSNPDMEPHADWPIATALPPGPLPATFIIPAEELAALLADRERLERLDAFVRYGGVETSVGTSHAPEMHEEPEAATDPHGEWNSRQYVLGYNIETEHRGCYRFHVLAKGREWRETLDRGLAAWDKDRATWDGAEIEED